MSEERINVGGAPNDGTGDSLRAAFTKTNADFDDLYNQVSAFGGTLAALNARFVLTTLSDFGEPDPTGINDTAPLFNDAIASVPTGAFIKIIVPNGTGRDKYKLATAVVPNGRYVFIDLTSGAGVGANYGGTGSGVLSVQRIDRNAPDLGAAPIVDTEIQGLGSETCPVLKREVIVNNGTNALVGTTSLYTNYATAVPANPNGGDIGEQFTAEWPNAQFTGMAMQARWEIAISPLTDAADMANGANWGVTCIEYNPVNNGPEPSFTEYDSAQSGGDQGVPATGSKGIMIQPDRWDPTGGYGGSCQIGVGIFPYPGFNNRPVSTTLPHVPTSPSGPYQAGFMSAFHVGNNGIAAGGTALYLGGRKDSVVTKAAILARHNWPSIVDTTGATLSASFASLGTGIGHQIVWGGLAAIYGDPAGNLRVSAGPGAAVELGATTVPTVAFNDDTTSAASTAMVQGAVTAGTRGFLNKFRNPGMDVAQRGASGSVAAGTTAYTLDGWQVVAAGAAAPWAQAYAASLSGNALRLSAATGLAGVTLRQRIESFMAGHLLADAGPQAITVRYAIHNGTSASLTPQLVTYTANAQDNFAAVTADLAIVNLQTILPGATGVVAYTFVPNAGLKNGYQIDLAFNAALNGTSGFIDVSHADVRATPSFPAPVLTAAPPAAEVRPVGVELAFCQRYFAKTFPQVTAPAQGTGVTAGAIIYRALYSGADYWGAAWRFPVTMRAAPTMTYFNPIGTNANWRNLDANADSGSTAAVEVPTGDQMVFPLNLQLSSDGGGQRLAVHAQASAEL